MKTVKDEVPKRHERHLVMRNGFLFTATPCYGMHSPWWVVRTMGEKNCGEVDPVDMLETDQHMPLNDAVSLYHKDSENAALRERLARLVDAAKYINTAIEKEEPTDDGWFSPSIHVDDYTALKQAIDAAELSGKTGEVKANKE